MNHYVSIVAAAICTTLLLAPSVGYARQESAKPFASIAATDPAVKKSVSAKKLDILRKRIGTDATVIGRVTQIYVPKGDALQVVNFAEPHYFAITAVLRKRDADKFPALKSLVGKKIIVTGRLVDYKDKAQIELTDPTQIKIVTE